MEATIIFVGIPRNMYVYENKC